MIRNYKYLLLLLCFYSLSIFAKTSIIVDTDAGSDDFVALMYLLKSNNVSVKAITIPADGEADCHAALTNISGLLQLMQRKVPIACGQKQYSQNQHDFPAWIHHEANTLGGAAKFLPFKGKLPKQDAVRLLNQTILHSKTPITILSIGPLTNLAQLINKYPHTLHNIKELYIMGGAIAVPGNIIELNHHSLNQFAEWNFYVNPDALAAVLTSGINIKLIPLDTTNQFRVSMRFYKSLKKLKMNAINKLLYEIFHQDEIEIKLGRWKFWDSASAVIAAGQFSCEYKKMKLSTEVSPEKYAGRIYLDQLYGRELSVCYKNPGINRLEYQLLTGITSSLAA